MTLPTTANRLAYTAAAGQTVFPYTFLVLAASDLHVYVNGALLASGYTVSGLGLGSGGNVTLTTACTGGEAVVLLRATDPTQQVDLIEGDPLPADSVEGMFDKAYAAIQDVSEEAGRAIKIPATSTAATTEMDLPDPATFPGKALKINDSGTGLDTFTVLSTDIASPITTKGDLIRGSVSGTAERKGVGSEGDVLTSRSGQIEWEQPVLSTATLTTKGDIPVRNDTVVGRHGVGADDSVLQPDSTQADGLIWRTFLRLKKIATPATPPVGTGALVVPNDSALERPAWLNSAGVVLPVRLVRARATPANLSNSAAETTLLSTTVFANTLNGTGLSLQIRAGGHFLNNTGGVNGVTFRVKLAGLTVGTVGTGNIAANATAHGFQLVSDIFFFAGGGTPPWHAETALRLGNVGIGGTSVGLQVQDFSTGAGFFLGGISTTVDQTLAVTAQLSATSTNLQLLDMVLIAALD